MSQKSIEDFKAQLRMGGVRPTMYEVLVTFPTNFFILGEDRPTLEDTEQLTMLTKAAQIPSETLTTVTVGIPAGGALKLPGSRIYEPWNCTVINDDQMRLRHLFEKWTDRVISRSANLRELNETSALSEVRIRQLDRGGVPIREWQLHYAYPTVVSSQQLAYDAVDTISEFNVQWNYHYHTSTEITKY
jgi:hypothetical protein